MEDKEKQRTVKVKIKVDTSELNRAIRKVKELIRLLKKANHLTDSL